MGFEPGPGGGGVLGAPFPDVVGDGLEAEGGILDFGVEVGGLGAGRFVVPTAADERERGRVVAIALGVFFYSILNKNVAIFRPVVMVGK